jgi:hypothetical protein
MREFNHWSESIKENKRKDKLDKVIFLLLIIGVGVVTWII